MSDFSPKRFFFVIFLLLSASALFASTPASRYEARMAYDPSTGRAILFGGLSGTDPATKQAYYLGDTWQWSGKWVQLFPNHAPSGRSGTVMVYDSTRKRVVLFSGHSLTADMNDTWSFNGTDWEKIETPNAPPIRFMSAGAYDSVRDRVVIFGGLQTKTTTVGSVTTTSLDSVYDTWEFDGTTWRQIGGEGPHVAKPTLAYDEGHNQVLMLGIDDKGATLMYAYDAAAGTWSQLKPATLPSCVNEGVFVYNEADQAPLFTSGICATTATDNETLEWDGSDWKKLDVKANAVRLFGAAAAFDASRNQVVQFGGTPPGSTPTNFTYLYTPDAGWTTVFDASVPGPRSLFAFASDPVHNSIWLYGGLSEDLTADDFWQFSNGLWQRITVTENAPSSCVTPNAVFDSGRQKVVLLCASSDTFEWDGTAWKKFPVAKDFPQVRRFSSMAYDPLLKKSVMFGGFTGTNYTDETWTWDGTQWTRVRNNPAPSRQLAAMWFDPNLKKIVIYGGVGRLTSQDRITRYDDMWTFDGNGWSQLKPAGGTPGMRYGAQAAVDPRTNHAILFGGLRVEEIAAVPPSTIPTQIQRYSDDTWEWDGTKWTRLTTDGVPPARENGGLAFDPSLNVMVMYGGWGGHYLSDMWTLTGTTWRARPESNGARRRATGRH